MHDMTIITYVKNIYIPIERLHVTSRPVKHWFLPHVLTVNYTKLYKMCDKKMVGSITISET